MRYAGYLQGPHLKHKVGLQTNRNGHKQLSKIQQTKAGRVAWQSAPAGSEHVLPVAKHRCQLARRTNDLHDWRVVRPKPLQNMCLMNAPPAEQGLPVIHVAIVEDDQLKVTSKAEAIYEARNQGILSQ